MHPVYSLSSYKPIKSDGVKKKCVFKINGLIPNIFSKPSHKFSS